MSAPPLPEAFGNYALGDFVEVVAPAAVSWLPQTTGWWCLGVVLLGFVLYRGWKRLRHWHRNRYRREAAGRLQQLAAGANSATLVSEVNRLLKLTALAAFSREQVAKLSGEDWVSFLNRHCPGSPFSWEQGRLLAVSTYRSEAIDNAAARQLLDASRSWISEHENSLDD
jgi:Domain of unknown function (DUF4381)